MSSDEPGTSGPRPAGGDGGEGPCEIELKLGLDGPEALAALAAAALRRGARAAPPVLQENTFFDTPSRVLRDRGVVVRVRREGPRHQLALKGARLPGSSEDLHRRTELEAELDPGRAARALSSGRLDPALLAEVLGSHPLVEEVRRAADGPLEAAGSFRNHRTRVAPLALPGRSTPVALELDRTEFPGGRVDHEVELELPPDAEEAGRALLASLLGEAGVEGRRIESKARRLWG